MENCNNIDVNKGEFIRTALAGALVAGLPVNLFSADSGDMQAVLAEVPKLHDRSVKALQEWVALPSIVAENRNYPQGPEYMAKLARAAGFSDEGSCRPPASRRLRPAQCWCAHQCRDLLHVQREAVRSHGVVVTSDGSAHRRETGLPQGVCRPWSRQPERPGDGRSSGAVHLIQSGREGALLIWCWSARARRRSDRLILARSYGSPR